MQLKQIGIVTNFFDLHIQMTWKIRIVIQHKVFVIIVIASSTMYKSHTSPIIKGRSFDIIISSWLMYLLSSTYQGHNVINSFRK